MRGRVRLRPVLKWSGTVACCLILVVLAVSNHLWVCRTWELRRADAPRHWRVNLILKRGAVGFDAYRTSHPALTGWTFGAVHEDASWITWHRLERHTYQPGLGERVEWDVPLWEPLLLVLIPTIVLWHQDRRSPPGHCRQCGYDLTGNESGRCPECGQPLEINA